MHWWETSSHADTLPYGPRMPVSSEQILHHDRYERGDAPLGLVFPPDSGVAYEDVLGENEIRVLLAKLAGSDEVQTVVPIGWGGDRYRLYGSGPKSALVWYAVWDDARSSERFLRAAGAGLRGALRPGYKATVDSLEVEGKPAIRYRAGARRVGSVGEPPQGKSRREAMSQAVRLARFLAALGMALLTIAAPAGAQQRAAIIRMTDSLVPYVEGATGLTFQHAPALGTRTRSEVLAYVTDAFHREYSPQRIHDVAVTYNLIGLLPDTAGLAQMLIDLHAQELRGYYDPETDSLFAVTDAPLATLSEVLAHELVHALQAQYVDLKGLRKAALSNDERTAFLSLIEGQAMFATMRLLAPRRNIVAEPKLWDFVSAHVRAGPLARPAYRRAPLWLREGLLAPYLYGAQFSNWWQASEYADTVPYGPRMPVSTEQILHFERYDAGDLPVGLRFKGDSAGVLEEDVVGELELHILAAQLAGAPTLGQLRWIGWGGDRFRVYPAGKDAALVWYLVWDDPDAAAAFRRGTGALLAARRRPGYRAQLDTLTAGGMPASRYVFAPQQWSGWQRLPEIEVMPVAPRRD